VAAAGLLVAAGAGWQGAHSAFAGNAGNPGNGWNTGAVTLTDDTAGVAAFNNVTGLVPGGSGSTCVLVTYTGSVAASVVLYTRNYAGALGPYLNLTIQTGDGANCAAFGAATTIFSGTLDSLRTSATGFGTGVPVVGAWTPGVAGAVKPYRFSYTLVGDDAAQGAGAAFDLVWEAHST
jgi:hypothetical protein